MFKRRPDVSLRVSNIRKSGLEQKSIKNSVSLCDAFHLVTSLAVHRESGNLTASDAAHQIPKAHALLGCGQQR
jgi:hypothetical protein